MSQNDCPKMPVKCGVENCEYNKSHMCYAHSIEVTPMGDKRAESSDSTCCSTFLKSNF